MLLSYCVIFVIVIYSITSNSNLSHKIKMKMRENNNKETQSTIFNSDIIGYGPICIVYIIIIPI